MNEVEKMYRNSGIEKCNRLLKPCPFGNECDDGCEHHWYPDFTAEKQLELIKWLAKRPLTIDNVDGDFEFSTGCRLSDFGSFEEALAELVNDLWQDLTEEERKQIRGILESEVRE